MNIPEIEKKILDFWKKEKIFEKSLRKGPASAKASTGKDFVFYDGPPFATGTPHYGHIVASLIKDIVPRYWTMQGYRVERKWGWDCHGLPIENIVEEELGLKNKKEIEKIGIEKFNETCRSKVLMYAEEWKKAIERLGRWADMDNAYKTMDLDFMESVWWVFKQLWDKGLIYEGYKSMHICPRCETTLSQSEVAQGYKDVKDIAVTVKFELEDQPRTFVLAWTTTPWTLIGNVALAVGKDIDYVKFGYKDETYIVSKKDFDNYGKGKILKKFKGKELVGKKYRPLFDYYSEKNLYTIQSADFVDVEEGTGIVHIAPAFGEDDMNLGKEKNLPFIQHVDMDGRIKKEAKDFAGLEVRSREDPLATDKKINNYLNKKDLIFSKEEYIHSYPHCWRCESPLLNYATDSWFVNVTKLKDKILKNAKNINWMPKHVKEGRFGKWLKGIKDWSISRERYWGTPIPIWVCGNENCNHINVIGSIEELKERSYNPIPDNFDLHRPNIDKIHFHCDKCEHGIMERISEVMDCWFDSGAMPFAQRHYPFENKDLIDKREQYPADFIAEGVDQTRCWFYYLHVLSTAIKNSEAFENVIANGMVLAEDGKKMSKRLDNYPEPMDVFDKYGADAVRYYLATSQVMKAEDLCFSEKEVDEVYKKVLLILLNVVAFYKLYESPAKDGFASGGNNVLDKWIISRIESLKKEITNAYNNYDLNKATRPIEPFINELSTWYLRRSRERIKGNDKDAMQTLKYVLLELSKIIAPVMPFMAEHIYKELGGELESVHLESWPEIEKKLIDKKLEEKMEQVRRICSSALQKRAEHKIGIRQPLTKLTVNIEQRTMNSELLDLIKDEINIQEIVFGKTIKLDTKLTPELKEQGLVREFIRSVQAERKKAGLTPKDKIRVYYNSSFVASAKGGKDIIEKNKDQIKKSVIAEDIIFDKEFKIKKV